MPCNLTTIWHKNSHKYSTHYFLTKIDTTKWQRHEWNESTLKQKQKQMDFVCLSVIVIVTVTYSTHSQMTQFLFSFCAAAQVSNEWQSTQLRAVEIFYRITKYKNMPHACLYFLFCYWSIFDRYAEIAHFETGSNHLDDWLISFDVDMSLNYNNNRIYGNPIWNGSFWYNKWMIVSYDFW